MKIRKKLLPLIVAGILALSIATPVTGNVITLYSKDLTGWTAAATALGPIVTENFADTTLVPGLTIVFGTNNGNAPASSIASGLYTATADAGNNPVPRFNFNLGTRAFGAFWNVNRTSVPDGVGTGILLVFDFGNLVTASVEIPHDFSTDSLDFFGVVADMPFVSVAFEEGRNQDPLGFTTETFDMNDAGFVAAVPEPAMLALLGLGLAGIGFQRRKRVVS